MEIDLSLQEREAHYRCEISNRMPPDNYHDAFLLKVYENLLESIIELQRLDATQALPTELVCWPEPDSPAECGKAEAGILLEFGS